MIILVTGLMRTGTSLISKQLHEMGVPMGKTMRFPLMREDAQLDWEDVEFTDKCLARLKGQISQEELEQFFVRYVAERKAQGMDPWGVKSPFLLPFIELFKKHAGDYVKVILTTRKFDDTLASIARQTNLREAMELQQMLVSHAGYMWPSLIVPIEDSWDTPQLVKNKLVELIRS